MKKNITVTTIIYCIITICIAAACNKKNCFDQALFDKNKNAFCTEDCPGVIGCDGKKYCNECIANAQGIAVK